MQMTVVNFLSLFRLQPAITSLLLLQKTAVYGHGAEMSTDNLDTVISEPVIHIMHRLKYNKVQVQVRQLSQAQKQLSQTETL